MKRWGAPDELAWERAMDHYLAQFDEFSDIQDARPQPLARLELASPKSGFGHGSGAAVRKRHDRT